MTEQKWIWPVIVTGDYPKIISSPDSFNNCLRADIYASFEHGPSDAQMAQVRI